MNRIKSKEQYEKIIMDRSRHQFIYGYNGKERAIFLKEIAQKYPIILDKSEPMGIYLKEMGLPPQIKANELDKIILATLSREYCHFSIASGVVDTTLEQIDEQFLNRRVDKLLDIVNKAFLNKSYPSINDLKELGIILTEVKQVYHDAYIQYTENGIINFANDLPISFMWLEKFIEYYKIMLNNKSYFGIIIDHQTSMSTKLQQAVNGLIGSRINGDLAMKIVCEPNGWETYYDLNGNFIANDHDYETVEIDDSNKKYLKKLIRNNKFS